MHHSVARSEKRGDFRPSWWDVQLDHLRPYTGINSWPDNQILIKFDIGEFLEKLPDLKNFIYVSQFLLPVYQQLKILYCAYIRQLRKNICKRTFLAYFHKCEK
jgi:hypothetical protein